MVFYPLCGCLPFSDSCLTIRCALEKDSGLLAIALPMLGIAALAAFLIYLEEK